MKILVLNIRRPLRIIRITVSLLLILATVMYFGMPTVMGIYRESIPAANETTDAPTVVIDAGHGGEDPGALGVNGSLEKDLNLAIAMELGAALSERGFNVVYTRTEDKMLYSEDENIKGFRKLSDLKNRVQIANAIENVILVSIHMNSYGESKYSGLQVYYKGDDKASRDLATSIQTHVRDDLQPSNDRPIKKGENIYLLENSKGRAVLIECGFLTNAEECEKLSQKEYQKELSFSIVCGIIEYIEN